nr:hypothetical protein [uncultured Chryseobacterium sp.]
MNKLLILCLAMIMSCMSTTAQKPGDEQKKAEIIISESQGGNEKSGFIIIKNEQEFQALIQSTQSSVLVEAGKESEMKYPEFPENRKTVLYNLGSFNSGDHTIREIKSISVKDNVLSVEVPYYESGGMEIQVMSAPWFIFSVPSDFQFTSVKLKYSK